MDKKIGQLIKERIAAEKMGVTEFSKKIGVERSNVYDIFKRESIDTALLKKIGQVLHYDFFQDLLEPETKKRMLLSERIGNQIMIPIELTEDEIREYGLKDRVLKVVFNS